MTKIEPALYRFRDSEQVIVAMPGYTPPSSDWTPIYTEAQMRQAMEACAAKADDMQDSFHPVGEAIRKLIKEMLP